MTCSCARPFTWLHCVPDCSLCQALSHLQLQPALWLQCPDTSGNITHWPTWSFHYTLLLGSRAFWTMHYRSPVCPLQDQAFLAIQFSKELALNWDFSSQHAPSCNLLQMQHWFPLSVLCVKRLNHRVPALQVCCSCLGFTWWWAAMKCCHARGLLLGGMEKAVIEAASCIFLVLQGITCSLHWAKWWGTDTLWSFRSMFYSALDRWSLTNFHRRKAVVKWDSWRLCPQWVYVVTSGSLISAFQSKNKPPYFALAFV